MSTGFQRARKQRAKLRLAIEGPSGSGKTYTGLATARAIAGAGGRIAVIDSERGSASLYADLWEFDVLELDRDFSPDRYIAGIRDAERAGYDVVLIDSLSHAWEGEGGVQEIVDKAKKGSNSFSGWAVGTPAYRALVDSILRAQLHVVATMRTKTEWVMQDDGRGRQTPQRVGTAPVMRQGIEFEFTVVADMDLEHNLTIAKTRCPALTDKRFRRPGPEWVGDLMAWLEDGAEPTPTPAALGKSRFAELLELHDDQGEIKRLLKSAGIETASALADDETFEKAKGLISDWASAMAGPDVIVGQAHGVDPDDHQGQPADAPAPPDQEAMDL